MNDSEEKVKVIKSLVTGRETLCPKCEKAILIRVNPAKNGNTRYKCPVCGENTVSDKC
jgi:predicted RNA-binding Zn-ribbon protein involved in translation (DUF1610 family)